MTDQFDSPWKEALEEYFEEGMAFFFPKIHADIDWSQGHEFLDKELEKVVRQASVTQQSVDKLVQVYQKSEADPTWVLVHLDVQSQHDKDFTKRMYQYNYRLFDRYDRTVVTLVIFGDDSAKWQPHQFERELWDCKVQFEFPSVKLRDYNIQELEQSTNPFAVVVLAHLYTKATQHEPITRYDLKWRLTRMLYERGYAKAKILSLYRYIDWLMALPAELEQKLDEQVIEYEETQTMPYVTSAERFGFERGHKAGLEEARQIWLQQELQTMRDNVLDVLQIRFGELPPLLVSTIKFLPDVTLLRQLLKKAVLVSSVAEFEVAVAEGVKPLVERVTTH